MENIWKHYWLLEEEFCYLLQNCSSFVKDLHFIMDRKITMFHFMSHQLILHWIICFKVDSRIFILRWAKIWMCMSFGEEKGAHFISHFCHFTFLSFVAQFIWHLVFDHDHTSSSFMHPCLPLTQFAFFWRYNAGEIILFNFT